MVQRVTTVAFEGIEARAVDVQVQVAPGLPAFKVVGLIVTRLIDLIHVLD
jgi:magnesium chelatase family protein